MSARRFGDEESTEIGKIYKAGISGNKIAGVYQTSLSSIHTAIRHAGIPMRKSYETKAWGTPLFYLGSSGYPIVMLGKLKGRALKIAMAMCTKGKRVRLHRLIMAMHLRRPLEPYEIVHHRDGNREHYQLSNLELLIKGTHHPGHGVFYQQWQEALTEIQRLKETQ